MDMKRERFVLHNLERMVEALQWDEVKVGNDLSSYARELLENCWDSVIEEIKSGDV